MSDQRITSRGMTVKQDPKRLSTFIAALIVGLGITTAHADTVTFRQGVSGYTGAVDTFLQQNPANAGTNNGASALLGWDGDDPSGTGYDIYTLIRFDNIFGTNPGQIPPGAVITSATLTYTVTDTGDNGSISQALTGWTAASTFNSFCGASCDQGSEYGPSVATAGAAALGTQTVDVRASVQAWSDGTTNNGWFITPTGTGGVDTRSSDYTTIAERPLLTVIFNQGSPSANIVRQPYLQMGTESSMTIVWRTEVATNSRVHYGATQGILDLQANNATTSVDHVVTITGLLPATRYWYDVGSSTSVQAGGSAQHFFETSPQVGSSAPFRVWVLGDSGNLSAQQLQVRNSMQTYTASNPPDLFVHVGDIAYDTGSDDEFTQKHFAVYQDIMRHTPSWHTLGNHEGTSTISGQPGTSTGPYYSSFVLPTAGEAGGEPSGTEAYYSFDYGNAHFICLNSTQVSRAANGPMALWLQADLAATNAQWVIAFWHHPPYSKGTHNSDTEIELVQMRENIMPILEAGGVDLVLSGHSHAYERSYLIDGTYTTPTPTFATLLGQGHIIDDGDGRPAGNGAYLKSPGINAHEGEVVLVAGHGGSATGGSLNHPVMFHSESAHGSVVLDLSGNTLSAVNLRSDGVVTDSFTLMKGDLPPRVAQTTPPKDDVLASLGSLTVTFSTPVTGVDAGDLTVNGSPATLLTPVSGTVYTFSGFAPPGSGIVTVVLATGGIADAGNSSLHFAGDSWIYVIDTAPPTIVSTQPDRGAHTSLLSSISVTFSKPVVNVDPNDLTVNGSPATAVAGISGTPGPYSFSGYVAPGPGLVNVVLLADGIHDTQIPAHNFAGDAWTLVRTQGLVINEFLASNNTAVTDENGEFDDYVEIFNPGSDPVDMGGMFLTDQLTFPAQYRIPLGVTIPAHGHLVFWCDSTPSQGPLHTSFNLLRTGEQIGLFASEAEEIEPIDTLTYGTQTTDLASGRFADGALAFVPMPVTPGAANTITCVSDGECTALDGACTDGVCSTGRCVSQPINEGGSCSTLVACMTGETCGSGICDGGTSTCGGGQTCDIDTGQCLVLPAPALPISIGATWKYLPGTAEPDPAWKTLLFNDSSWQSGASGFGYGPDCNTPALRGTTLSTMQNNYTSLYVRRVFSVPNPALMTSLTLTVDYDDAWVAYLNGTEVARSPGMGGTVGVPPPFNATTSTTDHECSTGSPANPAELFNLTSSIPLLTAGNNVLAIQGHNRSLTSTDFSLIPSLTATQVAGCATNADCGDANPCTDDICNLGTGTCSNVNDNTNLCTDGVACTSDVCSSGVCASSSNCLFGQTCDTGTGQCGLATATVSFQDGTAGYTSTVDTFVHAGGATTNNALATTLIVDGPTVAVPGDERQTLMRFDSLFASQGGPIPDGAVITSATLTLNITNGSLDGAQLHRMLIPWSDTNTWTTIVSGVQINDVEAVAAADVSSLFNGTVPATHAIDVTASVSAWSAGGSNFGWVLVTPAGGSDSWQFDSSEGATVSLRPKLSVTYSTAQPCASDVDCDDGDACNGAESCSGGLCLPGTSLICNDGNLCTTDSCVPATGCQFTNNTSSCNDGNACTTGDVCAAGACVPGTPLSCNDGAACTTDSCNSITGCVNTDTCTGGQTCNIGTGLCEAAPTAPPLPILAGATWTYFKGSVAPPANWNQLGFGAPGWLTGPSGFGYGPDCAATRGTELADMQNPPSTPGYVSLYLRREFYVPNAAAVTSLTFTVDFDDAYVAYVNGQEVSRSTNIAGTPPAETALASADHECSTCNGTCNAATVVAVSPSALVSGINVIAIQAHNVTLNSSDFTLLPSLTSVTVPVGCTTNAQCDDANACNGAETCVAGSCQTGTALTCNDSNVCTTDSCVPASGCVFTNNTNACTDSNACTTGDVCAAGACVPGAPLNCSDGAACTADSCNSITGCLNTDTCTGGQTCNIGTGLCQSAATQTTFQDGVSGYTGTVDTFLHAGSPTANNSLVTPLIVDGPTVAAPGDERQILLRFDSMFVSQGGPIPDGATITSAILTVNIVNPSPDGAELHRMLIPWLDTGTWNSLVSGVQRDGVEAVAAADVTSAFNGTVPVAHDINVTSSVAAWSINPAANNGWVLVTPAGLNDSWQFDSSEIATVALRPRLTVQYQAFTGPRAQLDCSLSAPTAAPGGMVDVDILLTNLGGLASVRGYQTKLLVTRTSGTGSLDIGCPGGVLVNEGRGDFIFSGQPSIFSVTNCGLALASSSLLSGAVAVGPGAEYLSTYSLTVSGGAAPGTTFNLSLAAFPDTALADAGADPIAYTTGPVCTLTITGECSTSAQCNDGNPCTDDICAAGSCTHSPNTAGCNDGDACTIGDTCGGGVCVSGTPMVCNDGNSCTTDSCSAGACQYSPSGACGVTGTVAYYRNGVAGTEPSTKPLANVGVDATSDLIAEDMTDASGFYGIGGLAGNLTIAPVPKYGSPRASEHNGAITSFDASLAAQHFVQLITLSSNQQIAADVTGNGSVSSLDAAKISQFAVLMIDHFDAAVSSGSDWKFLRCDSYVSATNHTCGAASYAHNPITGSPTDNFFGILLGDVSGNWAPVAQPLVGGTEESVAAADAVKAGALREAGITRRPADKRPGNAASAIVSLDGWSGSLLAGQRRELFVTIKNADGIEGLDLSLSFDSNRMNVLSVETAGIGGGFAAASHQDGDTARIAAYGPVPLQGSGVVLRITVEAKTRLGGRLPLSIEVQANEGLIPIRVEKSAREGGPGGVRAE